MTPPTERLSIFVAAVVAALALAGIAPRAALIETPGRTVIVIGARFDAGAAAARWLATSHARAGTVPGNAGDGEEC